MTTQQLRRSITGVLLLALASAASAAVQVREEKLSLPSWTSVQATESNPAGIGRDAPSPVPGTTRLAGTRELHTIVLENEYLRLMILPEVGGAVGRAVHKPTGDDLFFWEGKIKDWVTFWHSGVKAHFPAIYHLISTVDQPASWRIVRADDGSVTVAMWMEFSRFTEKGGGGYWGRYSNLLLSQHVTLRPGRADFEVAYRVLNPAAYRQGAKLWNNAIFPRNHTPRGVVHADDAPPPTDTQIIFPTYWASGHAMKDLHVYDPAEGSIAQVTRHDTSIFSVDMPHGFSGMWYPSVKVNRLRLCDPAVARGAKLYFRGEGSYRRGDPGDSYMYNFIELFGSFDNIMEGVENWLEPGHAMRFAQRYALVKGIGRADFANDHAAVHLELAGDAPALEVVTLSKVAQLSCTLDGKAIGSPRTCDPETPARFAMPAGTKGGRFTLASGDRTLMDVQLPLVIPNDPSRHEWIRKCNAWDSARFGKDDQSFEAVERYGDQFGYTLALERLTGAKATSSLPLGRMQYRAGMLPEAIKTLGDVTAADADDGEAWTLLGCARLESQQPKPAADAFAKALGAARPYPSARYFLALAALRDGDRKAARAQLAELRKAAPAHWEGRLLAAWLDADDPSTRAAALTDLAAMDREDPADPRVQAARLFAAERAAETPLTRSARDALSQLSTEPGAPRRLREFNASTCGIYMPPQRMER